MRKDQDQHKNKSTKPLTEGEKKGQSVKPTSETSRPKTSPPPPPALPKKKDE